VAGEVILGVVSWRLPRRVCHPPASLTPGIAVCDTAAGRRPPNLHSPAGEVPSGQFVRRAGIPIGRCPTLHDRCRQEIPELFATDDGGQVPCHGVEEAVCENPVADALSCVFDSKPNGPAEAVGGKWSTLDGRF